MTEGILQHLMNLVNQNLRQIAGYLLRLLTLFDQQTRAVSAAADADIRLAAFARAVDHAAHDGHLERHVHALQLFLHAAHDAAHVDAGAPAGRTGDILHEVLAQPHVLQNLNACRRFKTRIACQRNANRIADAVQQQRTDADGALSGVLSMRALVIAEPDELLRDLAYRDVVYVEPDRDQEEVAEEMSKYNLAAIPVCDENRHILGIVTVDDAMDVMTEEHQEDLQIAGVSAGGENTTGETSHAIAWFVQRQYWIVVWAVCSVVMASLLNTLCDNSMLFIFPMCAMPVVLLAATRMVAFVKNFFLENDDGDDEKRPYLWFWLQNTVTGLILALVVYLCGQLVATAAFTDITVWKAQLFIACFNVAALVTLLSSMSSVVYLKVLYWCDEHDRSVSGTAMQLTSVLVSAILFSALAVLAIVSIMGA